MPASYRNYNWKIWVLRHQFSCGFTARVGNTMQSSWHPFWFWKIKSDPLKPNDAPATRRYISIINLEAPRYVSSIEPFT